MKVIGSISKKTNLPQTTSRLTARPYHGPVNEARGRQLVCSFVSGDLLAMRPLGLGAKRTVHIPLATLYENALYAEARAIMRDKVNKRRSK
jgi:hypothetical protein